MTETTELTLQEEVSKLSAENLKLQESNKRLQQLNKSLLMWIEAIHTHYSKLSQNLEMSSKATKEILVKFDGFIEQFKINPIRQTENPDE